MTPRSTFPTPVALGVKEVEEWDTGGTRHKCVSSSWAWNARLHLFWAVSLCCGSEQLHCASLCVPHFRQTNCTPRTPLHSLSPGRQAQTLSRAQATEAHVRCPPLPLHPGLRPQIARQLYLEVCSAVPGNYKYGSSALPANSPGWAGQCGWRGLGGCQLGLGISLGGPWGPSLGGWGGIQVSSLQEETKGPLSGLAWVGGQGRPGTSHFLPWLPGASWLRDSCLDSQ